MRDANKRGQLPLHLPLIVRDRPASFTMALRHGKASIATKLEILASLPDENDDLLTLRKATTQEGYQLAVPLFEISGSLLTSPEVSWRFLLRGCSEILMLHRSRE